MALHCMGGAQRVIPHNSQHPAPTRIKGLQVGSRFVYCPTGCWQDVEPEPQTPSQRMALDGLESRVHMDGMTRDVSHWASNAGETVGVFLYRYLHARNWDEDAALAFLKADLDWRFSHNLDELREMLPEIVLGGVEEDCLHDFLPARVLGFDRAHRPVILLCAGRQQVAHAPVDRTKLIKYVVWLMERCADLLPTQTLLAGRVVNQFTVIIDAAGFNLYSLTSRANLEFVKQLTGAVSAHYPERLAQLLVVNAPASLAAAWRVLHLKFGPGVHALDAATARKVRFLPRNEQAKILLRCVDAETLPLRYGGRANGSTERWRHAHYTCRHTTARQSGKVVLI